MSNSAFSSNFNLGTTSVTAGTYGNNLQTTNISVGGDGRLYAVSQNTITGTSGDFIPLLDGTNTWSARQTFGAAPAFTDQQGSQLELGVRQKIQASLNLYVSPSGSDSNAGTSSSTPFQTIQKAFDYIIDSIDSSNQTVTVNLAAGTYTNGATIYTRAYGITPCIFVNGVGSSTVISSTDYGFIAKQGGQLAVSNLKIQVSSGIGILSYGPGSTIGLSNIEFGYCASGHAQAGGFAGLIIVATSIKISGGGSFHIQAFDGGVINYQDVTTTLSGTPTFTNAFVVAQWHSNILFGSTLNFIGGATGTRYISIGNSVINGLSGSANYLPGSVAGYTSLGGLYV